MFITAYMMRKLNEAHALSNDLIDSRWKVSTFKRTQPTPHRSWFRISYDGKTWRQPLEDHYDLAAPQPDTLQFDGLCNRVIHHFAFEVRRQPASGELEFLFNSDHTKAKLYAMTLSTYIKVVEEAHYDEIRWCAWTRSPGSSSSAGTGSTTPDVLRAAAQAGTAGDFKKRGRS